MNFLCIYVIFLVKVNEHIFIALILSYLKRKINTDKGHIPSVILPSVSILIYGSLTVDCENINFFFSCKCSGNLCKKSVQKYNQKDTHN